MIISRYISKEIIVNICWISLVLFGLVLFSRFNIFLSQAEVGKISPESIFFALILFSPELVNLIFPLSVFLGVGFVLTPIYKSHFSFLESSSYKNISMINDQKYLIFGIFFISFLLSTLISPFFTSKGQMLIDQDNTFAAKIKPASGLVSLHAETFNVFGMKEENGYKELIFIDGQNTNRFLFGQTGQVSDEGGKSKLVLNDGFMFDKENNIISRFDSASVPLEQFETAIYKSTISLISSNSIEDIRELFKRLAIPIFCLISLLFSMSFSSYSSFWGRERTYFVLTMLNILYLVLTIAPFETDASSKINLAINFFSVHVLFFLLMIATFFKQTKRVLGYEGL